MKMERYVTFAEWNYMPLLLCFDYVHVFDIVTHTRQFANIVQLNRLTSLGFQSINLLCHCRHLHHRFLQEYYFFFIPVTPGLWVEISENTVEKRSEFQTIFLWKWSIFTANAELLRAHWEIQKQQKSTIQ